MFYRMNGIDSAEVAGTMVPGTGGGWKNPPFPLVTSGFNNPPITKQSGTTLEIGVGFKGAAGTGAKLSRISAKINYTIPVAADVQVHGLTATASGPNKVTLSWRAVTAASIGVYNMYRSATSGFTPGSSNMFAQGNVLTYDNVGLAPGTYYYRVAAQDVSGKIYQPSDEVKVTVTGPTLTLPDLELRSVRLVSPSDPYTFFLNLCMNGPQSINDLKLTNPNVKNFPIHYLINGVPATDASGVGVMEDWKNGTCNDIGVGIQTGHRAAYDLAKKIEFRLDYNNVIPETNENNNSSTYTAPAPVVSVVAPNGGENWFAGSTYTIKWTGGLPADRIGLTAVPSGPSINLVAFDIAKLPNNSGSYPWIIPANAAAGTYTIRVCILATDNTCATTDYSDAGFTIGGASGSLSVSLDPSSPGQKLLSAGSVDNILSVLDVAATGEDIRLDKLGLQLGSPLLNTYNDLSKATIWLGATKVGEAYFTAGDYATATITGVTVPKDSQVLLTIKADMGVIGNGLAGRSGHLVKVEYDADSASDKLGHGATGVGLTSGSSIFAGGSDSVSNGGYLVKSIPAITKLATSGKYTFGMDRELYRFAVTVKNNSVSLYKFTFNVNSTGDVSKVYDFRVYCYSDAGLTVPACGNTNGLLNQWGLLTPARDASGNVAVFFNPTAISGNTPEAIRIPAGSNMYFKFVASIDTGAGNITTKMNGDGGWEDVSCDKDAKNVQMCDERGLINSSATFANTAGRINALAMDRDFIWSDNATNTSQSINDYDWMNGFVVPGLSNNDSGASEVVTP